ncbi:MAG: MATE family efflux transporter, partial [Candidatus Hydrogenedentes bacterium]|nr:MATE family efflux transporter [Candidatus Hydrogenedentota bacterium]
MTSFDSDIVSGSVVRSVVKLAWPIAITQLIAGIHGIVDQILVGNYVSFHAQAAIGVSWQLFLVIFVFLSSLFHGMNILIARYSGRQDREAINRIAYDVFITSGYLILLFIAPLGYFLSPALLDLVNAEPEVQEHALPYLRILFTASLPLFLMFVLNGAFQSSGNPKIPLYLGILTTIVNVIASYILITGLGPFPELGTAGAAIGTCLGPLPSILIGLILIQRHKVLIGPPERFSIFPDLSVLKAVIRLGLPSGIQAVLLNIGGVALLSFIGSLEESAEAQAAYTICYVQLFSVVTWTGFGLRAACATVMGQNMGAGKNERGKQAVYVGAGLGFLWA